MLRYSRISVICEPILRVKTIFRTFFTLNYYNYCLGCLSVQRQITSIDTLLFLIDALYDLLHTIIALCKLDT